MTQSVVQDSAEPASPPPKRRGLGSLAALGAVLAVKAKAVLGLLKLATLGKFALTGLSMVAMVWFYAVRGGLAFAIGFVVLLLIHELGHAFAIRRAGLNSGWPVFIPMIGALITLKEAPKSRVMEAEIGYAGPLFGTAASLAVAGLYLATRVEVFLSLAYVGFFLNLFNMVPLYPLDGGRVAQVFSPRAWIVGGLLMGLMFFVTHAPQLLFIAAMALSGMRRKNADDKLGIRTDVTPDEQRTWTLRYFGLAFFLGGAMYLSYRLLHPAAI